LAGASTSPTLASAGKDWQREGVEEFWCLGWLCAQSTWDLDHAADDDRAFNQGARLLAFASSPALPATETSSKPTPNRVLGLLSLRALHKPAQGDKL